MSKLLIVHRRVPLLISGRKNTHFSARVKLYNRLMSQRCVVAAVLVCIALGILLLRYIPARAWQHDLGDPLDHAILAGASGLQGDDAALSRRLDAAATLRVPLDRRGALTLDVRLRAGDESLLARLELDSQPLIAQLESSYRTYHLLGSGPTSRESRLTLTTLDDESLLADQIAATGRGGFPAWLDLAALLAVAAIPALLLALTLRLPLDWSIVASAGSVGLLLVLPRADLLPLIAFGPLLALLIGGLALLPATRAHPTLVLIALSGLVLRCYGLGWGAGYAFHPDERALLDGTAQGALPALTRYLGRASAYLSGNPIWRDGWALVLLGRVLSALSGVIGIVLTYELGRLLLRPRWALLAAAFVAVAPVLAQQSHLATATHLELVVLLATLIGSVTALGERPRAWWIGLGGALGATLLLPFGWTLLVAPLIVALQRRPRPTLAYGMVALLLVSLLASISALLPRPEATAASIAPAASNALSASTVATTPYIYPLFGIVFWGVGPLLMQLGVVGWGAGLALALTEQRHRRWLPVLITLAAYFLVAGRGPAYNLGSLTALVPGLCLTAALLLQTFALRLPFRLGQRTVRLLAGTALLLALITTLGHLNLYRASDSRVAAARWLAAHAREGAVLFVGEHADASPFRAIRPELVVRATWPEEVNRIAAEVAAAEHLVISEEAMRTWPACARTALQTGRFGFAQRADFEPLPRLGGWRIDDSAADAALRVVDHPRVRIYSRIADPSPAAVEAMIDCADR